jgi:hypothetical protein
MRAYRLAFSLIRVPRLFASLFLIPLIFGLLIVAAQLLVTAMFLKAAAQTTKAVEEHVETRKGVHGTARKLLFGTREMLPPAKICRWKIITDKNGKPLYEEAPSPDCAPKRLDVAVRTKNPETFDVSPYQKLFNGNAEAIHVCRACQPDVLIIKEGDSLRTYGKSVWALLLLQLSMTSETMDQHVIEFAKDKDRISNLIGPIYFSAYGFRKSFGITTMNVQVAAVLNVASLVVISLWLALKAHRKVLDYFARNGALLPMVAATGKQSFYSALWILTILRVGAFLVAAIPATLIVFSDMLEDETNNTFFGDEWFFPYLWIVAIGLSFALTTLIASISDLKQRHTLMSFFYLYAPMLICGVGTIAWGASFLADSELFGTLRNAATALPILGITPIILSPLFQPSLWVIVTHAILTFVLIYIFLKRNARWFAAHLEEL